MTTRPITARDVTGGRTLPFTANASPPPGTAPAAEPSRDEVRRQVRLLLEQSAAFRALPPEKQRLLGLYGQATLDYRDWAYMTVTGRNDWSSTLPTHANSYFYPSVALGLIFTDALEWQSNLLTYGKLRLSYAKVGADAPPYSLSSTYSSADAPGAAMTVWPASRAARTSL